MPDTYLTTAEAARYIGMSESFLRNGRCQKRENQPPYIKVGRSCIRYKRADLDAWLAERRVEFGEVAA